MVETHCLMEMNAPLVDLSRIHRRIFHSRIRSRQHSPETAAINNLLDLVVQAEYNLAVTSSSGDYCAKLHWKELCARNTWKNSVLLLSIEKEANREVMKERRENVNVEIISFVRRLKNNVDPFRAQMVLVALHKRITFNPDAPNDYRCTWVYLISRITVSIRTGSAILSIHSRALTQHLSLLQKTLDFLPIHDSRGLYHSRWKIPRFQPDT